jgi:hypothetical protein
MWCVADLDEDYIANMEDTLETYERPYDPQQPVVCLDEKPVTLHAEVRPFSAARPGREARRDNEYERCGTANVFCAVERRQAAISPFPHSIVRGLNSLRSWPSWPLHIRRPRPSIW